MAVKAGDSEVAIKAKMAKLPSDINIAIADPAMRFITGESKRIDVRGPVFTAVKGLIK